MITTMHAPTVPPTVTDNLPEDGYDITEVGVSRGKLQQLISKNMWSNDNHNKQCEFSPYFFNILIHYC